jgi:CubicO group peptidase (beta-lactamase class C family)
MMPYTKILFKPGSKYSYSNPAIIFLGQVIEQISGDNFEVYMDKNVLKPLEMYRTYYDNSPYHFLPDRSNSYFLQDGKFTTNGLDFDTGITAANGGLNAPLGDMVNYISFLTNSVTGYEILKRSSLEEMWQVQVPIDENGSFKTSMGLSYFILEQNGVRYMGHTGTQKGFHSFFYIEPDTRTAAIFVVNTYEISHQGGSPTRRLSAEIRDALFEKVFPLFRK